MLWKYEKILPKLGILIQKQDLFTQMKHSSLAHKILDEFYDIYFGCFDNTLFCQLGSDVLKLLQNKLERLSLAAFLSLV